MDPRAGVSSCCGGDRGIAGEVHGEARGTARRQAFAALHQEHASGIYNLARRFLGNREDAQDISQDVLLKAYKRLGKPGELNQRAWLYKVRVARGGPTSGVGLPS